ncbi:hypothetical protein XF_0279 [Xylella fastidiosa 9a5c]|uniref:Uncharacterized protein n=3 Tax=Xylella fastidiosa TaxID=2371 RepID=Q9PGL9_XYLFA|nr:hypothetical protein XF_0279 [Xylella fastidiosa 9a5c]
MHSSHAAAKTVYERAAMSALVGVSQQQIRTLCIGDCGASVSWAVAGCSRILMNERWLAPFGAVWLGPSVAYL